MSSSPAGRYDYHIHPAYSIDAEGSMDDYCRAALERGLDEICFTTHVDTEPEAAGEDSWVSVDGRWVPVDGPWIERYLTDILAVAARYAPSGLAVKAGLEIGYHDGVADKLGDLINSYPFDFILGSVHRVDVYTLARAAHVAQMFRQRGAEQALMQYFDRVARAAACGIFDCLGHLDLYRRTMGVATEDDVAGGRVFELAVRSLETAAARGVGIEINTRGARKGREYLSPGPGLLRMAAAAGIRWVTIGSDAHTPATLAAGLEVGRAEAPRAGFGDIATFSRRQPTLHRIATGEVP